MCGIAGQTALDSKRTITADALRPMGDVLRHRGPDDEGCYIDPRGRCGLAFRRLAIIDLATGNQPIGNERGDVHVIFNGEIYNFRELRQALIAAGHTFATESDSETIVHAYEEYGDACFERFAGMFAIAIWDEKRRRLLLARDRFGKKPLVYAIYDGVLYFASELKAILAALPTRPEIDPQALHQYLIFQYVPAPHAIYHGFAKVEPGTMVSFSAGELAPAPPQRFYRVPDPPVFSGDYADAQRELTTQLTAAVERRLISDVPLGAFLSGGIDSSIVVALMRKLGVQPLRTFSIGFSDERYDETRHARAVAEAFETEHHVRRVTPDAHELLDALAWHYDEPFADSSAIPTFYLSRFARESVTAALTGDGGDEAFLGYDRYRAAQLAARLDAIPGGVRAMLAAGARLVPHGRAKSRSNRLYRFLVALGQTPALRYLAWINVFEPARLRRMYRPEFAARVRMNEPTAWFGGLFDDAVGDAAARAATVDFASYLPFDLLTKVDIASMASSLECRSPFLDHALIAFARSLPTAWRLGRDGKQILRDWARETLPAEVLRRPKMGFGVPIGEWFRGPLRRDLESRLRDPQGVAQRIFDADALERLLGEHRTERANHAHRLWALLMLDAWSHAWGAGLG